jgi:transposase
MKLSVQQFKTYLNKAQDKSEYRRIQAVFLRIIKKKPAKDVEQIINVCVGTIYQWSYRYNKFGIDGLLNKPKGGNRLPLMAKEDEKKFFQELKDDGAKGVIITANAIKSKLETKIKTEISHMSPYNLLKRNDWRKVAPRPRNPRTKPEDREAFKNNFHKLVTEVIRTFDPNDTRPLIIIFQDEARFGRINALRRCWAPTGIRPHVDFQVIRQFTYVYATVCPHTGQTFSLILPDADSEMMNLFLSELMLHYKGYRVIMVADQASWHRSASLKKYDNLRFIFLPPASPELNPAEHLWEHVREKYFANRAFDSLEDVEKGLEGAFHDVYLDIDTIRSLVSFSWVN